MKPNVTSGRVNQKLRTRAALLEAAAALIEEGRRPTVDEAAEGARVSRATAYRYFPSRDDLVNEAILHAGTATADARIRGSFAGMRDPADRADAAEQGLHDLAYDNEFQMRLLLRASLDRWLSAKGARGGVPTRQARRKEWFDAALEPLKGKVDRKVYRHLTAALCILTGVESLIVLEDVLGLGRREGRRVKSWAVRALVGEALRQSRRGSGRSRPARRR